MSESAWGPAIRVSRLPAARHRSLGAWRGGVRWHVVARTPLEPGQPGEVIGEVDQADF